MTNRCDATIEHVAYPGAPSVLSRRYCRAYPLRGFDPHCRYHLTYEERQRLQEQTATATAVATEVSKSCDPPTTEPATEED